MCVDFNVNTFHKFIELCPIIEDLALEIMDEQLNMELNVPKIKFFWFNGPFEQLSFEGSTNIATTFLWCQD